LLYETLKTIELLIPVRDRNWLGKKLRKGRLDGGGRWNWPWKKPTKKPLDQRLKAPFKFWYIENWDPRPLTNRRELFERYPYWAVRLHALYEEAEDPTPVSWIGRWSERRKAARHTFWLTYIAFVVALLFGIMGALLGTFQVWIAWCTWGGNGSSACNPGIATTSSTTAISSTSTSTAVRKMALTWEG
jgi:hypothetical protein